MDHSFNKLPCHLAYYSTFLDTRSCCPGWRNSISWYSEQQNHLSVGHFHKDCFVVLETLGLNLWNLEDMYFDILSFNLRKIMWSEQELSRQGPIQNGSTLEWFCCCLFWTLNKVYTTWLHWYLCNVSTESCDTIIYIYILSMIHHFFPPDHHAFSL